MNRREFLGTAAVAAVLPTSILSEPKKPSRFSRSHSEKVFFAGCQGTDDSISWELHLNYEKYCVIYGYRDFHELCNKIIDLATGSGPECQGKYITFGGEEIRLARRLNSEFGNLTVIDPQEVCLVIYENGEARLPYSWGGEWRNLDTAMRRAWIRKYAAGDYETAKRLRPLHGGYPTWGSSGPPWTSRVRRQANGIPVHAAKPTDVPWILRPGFTDLQDITMGYK